MTDRLLLDTNAVIYALRGVPQLTNLLRDKKINISFITEIELHSWPQLKADDNRLIKGFVDSCQIIEYSFGLKQEVILLRKKYRLKMADAFIAATAIQFDFPFVSADSVFDKVNELNLLKINL